MWAYSYTSNTVDHWDGRRWTATSVASLLPPPSHRPAQVTGVIALSPGDVYATAITAATPIGGPLVVLHYNGRGWTKVASGTFGGDREQRIVPDGRGGLWLAADASVGGQRVVPSCSTPDPDRRGPRAAEGVLAPAARGRESP